MHWNSRFLSSHSHSIVRVFAHFALPHRINHCAKCCRYTRIVQVWVCMYSCVAVVLFHADQYWLVKNIYTYKVHEGCKIVSEIIDMMRGGCAAIARNEIEPYCTQHPLFYIYTLMGARALCTLLYRTYYCAYTAHYFYFTPLYSLTFIQRDIT